MRCWSPLRRQYRLRRAWSEILADEVIGTASKGDRRHHVQFCGSVNRGGSAPCEPLWAHSAGSLRAINVRKTFWRVNVTILTSLLGTKAFGLIVYLWQAAEATPAPTPGVNHFSPIVMVKSMGAVAIGVVIVSFDHVSYSMPHGRTLPDDTAARSSRASLHRGWSGAQDDRIEEAINITTNIASRTWPGVSSGLRSFALMKELRNNLGDEIEASKRACRELLPSRRRIQRGFRVWRRSLGTRPSWDCSARVWNH